MGRKFVFGLGIVLLHFIGNISYAQDNSTKTDSKTVEQHNWHNLDLKKNRVAGISTDKAYTELLKGKSMTNVVVAVLDGGVDINHEDLKDKIWTNPGEIPGNGIDDDHNGYIDDVHGWNFIGNAEGKDIDKTTLEITRLYKKLGKKYNNVNALALKGQDLEEYRQFLQIKDKFLEKSEKAKKRYDSFQNFAVSYLFCDSIIRALVKKDNYTADDIKSINADGNDQIEQIKKYMLKLDKSGLSREEFNDYREHLENQIKYQLNTDYDPRAEIIGDNPDVFGSNYGNNDVIGPDPNHGTFVSGIIAANRNNKIGINGIADSVKIMVVRVIPNGDEYDKDVANAIIYAVNNGAKVLNCSFGKSYSPDKRFVDEALKYARQKDVLIVHAAGNDSEDNDSIMHYPTNLNEFGNEIDDNWLTVGASSLKKDKTLAASFSNYGKKTVDLFAPGHNIYSTKPNNKYGTADGTSFSAPMVTGTAALLKSVYPDLTAGQIKEIILKSVVAYPKLKVYKPNDESGKKSQKIKFSELSSTAGILNVYAALKLAESYNRK